MSRKHYVAVAAVLAGQYAAADTDAARVSITAVAVSLCRVFRADNAAFDADRFLTACGVAA